MTACMDDYIPTPEAEARGRFLFRTYPVSAPPQDTPRIQALREEADRLEAIRLHRKSQAPWGGARGCAIPQEVA